MRVAVAGAGGMGREALAWLRDARPDVNPVAFFVADAKERPAGADVALAIVDSVDELVRLGVAGAVLGIGAGPRRRVVAEQLAAKGIALLPVLHPTAYCGPGVVLEDGAVVAPGAVLTRDVTLGVGAIVNFRAAAGHDCTFGDFSFVGPGAVLAGDVHIGALAMVGAGAVVLPRRSVGDGATVGAGAVVTRDVLSGAVVVGNPGRPLDVTDGGVR